MKIPDYLKEGDTIGITACSCGILDKIDKYKDSIFNIKAQGFGILETKNVYTNGVVSSSSKQRAIELNQPNKDDALDVLHKLGGFDIAALCGVFLGGALYRVPIVIDGFISAMSALVATRLCPNALQYMLPSHVSAEPASRMTLDALGLSALIQADMRLGEGTGAVALFPLLDLALVVYQDLMTFADIGM